MSVNWGIMGTAGIAKGCMIPGLKNAEGCDLYAIAGRSKEKTDEFKETFGFTKAYYAYDSLIADPDVDAVYIPLPNHLHKEWVIKSLKAGKHVLCEKPLALNYKDAEEMFNTAKENNVILAEAYAYLNSPIVAALKEEVASGVIGKVDYIDTAFLTQGYIEDFRIHKEFGGGAFYDLGCYCTTMILSLIDSDIEYAKAMAEFTDEDVDYFTACLLKFKNGARASFNVGMNLGTEAFTRYDRLFIHGSKGSIRSDFEYNKEGDIEYTVITDGNREVKKVFARSNYALEAERFARCIEGKGTLLVTPEFSMKNAKIMDMLLESMGY